MLQKKYTQAGNNKRKEDRVKIRLFVRKSNTETFNSNQNLT